MDNYHLEQCQHILNKIEKKPLCRMIREESWTDVTGQLNLKMIQQKLNEQQYLSVFDFSLDLRLLLEQRDIGNEDFFVQNLILQDITQWLLDKLSNYPSCPEEKQYMDVRTCVKKITLIFTAFPTDESHVIPDSSQQSSSNNLNIKGAGLKRLEALQSRIEKVKRPEELERILTILQKHIPHIILTPEIVIEGRYLTKACATELRDYLNTINV